MTFFQNRCPYDLCRRNYFSLSDLITHIEGSHLDFDPNKIEQLEAEKPDSLHLSYVLKFGEAQEPSIQYSLLNEAVIHDVDVGANEVVSTLNNNYLSDFHVNNDARLNLDVASLGINNLFTLDGTHSKPYLCNMKDCGKRYKNVNGIKYHYKKHHQMLTPTLKKVPVKHKSLLNVPKPRCEKHYRHGLPLYGYPTPVPKFLYHNPISHRVDDCEPSEFFYTLPTSDAAATQVPLPNMSFNFYNVSEVGETEDFSGRNSTYFLPSF